MGRRDIVEFLLEKGARIDIFCAAMMGQLDAVKSFLTLQPKLIDAKGPHGFTLHFHAQVGGKEAENVLDYLQSVKKIELKPNPFLKKPGREPGRSRDARPPHRMEWAYPLQGPALPGCPPGFMVESCKRPKAGCKLADGFTHATGTRGGGEERGPVGL